MLFSASLLACAITLGNAAVLENFKRDGPALSVDLAPAENAQVLATVTNVGTDELKLLTLGTLLDSAPVEKLYISDESCMCSATRNILAMTMYYSES